MITGGEKMSEEIPLTARNIKSIIGNIKKRYILPKVGLLRMIESQKTEIRLIEKWQGGNQRAGLLLIGAHLKLVLQRIEMYHIQPNSWMFEPLFKAGIEGLCKAGKKFDVNRGLRFSTYARWWVLSAVIDELLSSVTLVSGIKGRIQATYPSLTEWKRERNILLDQPIPDDLIEAARAYCDDRVAMLVTRETVQNTDLLLCGMLECDSLNEPVRPESDDSDSTFMDLIQSDAPGPDVLVEEKMDGGKRHQLLYETMERMLNEREMRIIKARRLRDPATTLEELGKEFGVSKERIRQIEFRAIEKLKAAMQEQMPECTTDNATSTTDVDRVIEAVHSIKSPRHQMILIDYQLERKTNRRSMTELSHIYGMSISAVHRLRKSAEKRLKELVPNYDPNAFDEALAARELAT
jgi:RNA polymerase sigma-32 factor